MIKEGSGDTTWPWPPSSSSSSSDGSSSDGSSSSSSGKRQAVPAVLAWSKWDANSALVVPYSGAFRCVGGEKEKREREGERERETPTKMRHYQQRRTGAKWDAEDCGVFCSSAVPSPAQPWLRPSAASAPFAPSSPSSLFCREFVLVGAGI